MTVLPELERSRFILRCAVLDLSVQDMSLPLRVISDAIRMYTALKACSKRDAECEVVINTSACQKIGIPNIWKDKKVKNCQKNGKAYNGLQPMDIVQLDKSDGDDEDVNAVQRRQHDRFSQKPKQESDNARKPPQPSSYKSVTTISSTNPTRQEIGGR